MMGHVGMPKAGDGTVAHSEVAILIGGRAESVLMV